MELQIVFSPNVPKYEAIYRQLKQWIVTKQLASHVQLPAKRTFAQQLHVSVHTVQTAYEQLVSEGYVYTKERSGYFVSPFHVEWHEETTVPPPQNIVTVPRYNLKNGQVDEHVFPIKMWTKLYRDALRTLPFHSSHWQGELALREQIAHYVQLARGIACSAAHIFICSGTQQQLDMLCTFFQHYDIALEEPGFFRANAVFTQHNKHVTRVAVDENGACVPNIANALYYVTPAHQFPLGYVMPMERKMELLHWANATNSYIIEDDYDAEFRYKGLPIPPLAQLDQLQRVIYFGTFSKTIMPSLRIGYIILPTHLLEPFHAFFAAHKSTVSRTDQLVLAEFLAQRHFTRHIDKMRTLYRKKRQRLLTACARELPQCRVFGDAAGLHIILELPQHLHEARAISLAAEAGIAIDAVSTSYTTSKPTQFVMLGFGAIAYDDIDEAIQMLATCWGV